MNIASSSSGILSASLKSVLVNMAAFALVSVGLQMVFYAIDNMIVTTEELEESARNSAEEFENLKSKGESLSSELERISQRMDELNSKKHLTFTDKEELEKLKETSEELQRQLDLNEALAKVANSEARENALEYFNKESTYEKSRTWDTSEVDSGFARQGKAVQGDLFSGNQIEIVKDQVDDYIVQLEKLAQTQKSYDEFKIANPDESKYTKEQIEQLNNLTGQLSMYKTNVDNLDEVLPETIKNLNEFKKSLDPNEDGELLNKINEVTDAYSGIVNGVSKKETEQFDLAWNSEEFANIREELTKLSAAGNLDEATMKQEHFKEFVEATGVSAEKATEQINAYIEAEVAAGKLDPPTPTSFTEVIGQLDSMKDAFLELDKAYNNSQNTDDGVLFENIAELNEKFADVEGIEDYISAIQDAKGNAEESQKAFDNLATAYINQSGILKMLNEDTANLIQSYLEENGIVNASEIVQAGLAQRKAETAWETQNLSNATYEQISALADEATATDETKRAYEAYIAKKLLAQSTLDVTGDISALAAIVRSLGIASSAWDDYNRARNNIAQMKSNAKKTINGTDYYVYNTSENGTNKTTYLTEDQYDKATANFEEQSKKLADEIDAQMGTVKVTTNAATTAKNVKKSGSKKKEDKETKEYFDWIQRLIDNVTKKIENLQKKAEDLLGWRVKNQMQDTIYDELTKKIDILTQAHDRYMQEAESVGLSDEYKTLIQNGAMDIDTIVEKSGNKEGTETLKQQINDYQKWYDLAQSTKTELESVRDEQQEIADIKLDNIIDDYDKIVERLQKASDAAIGWKNQNKFQDQAIGELRNQIFALNGEYERNIQLMNQIALSDAYKTMIQNGTLNLNDITDENILNLVLQYSELLQNARDCEDAIEDVNDSIREAEELKLDNIVNDFESILSLMEKYTNYRKKLLDIQSRQGTYDATQSDYQQLIDDQIDIYKQLSEEYETLSNELSSSDIEKGSEKWNEIRDKLVDIKTEMLDCADAVEDFKDQILELRFKEFDDLIKKLDQTDNRLSDLLSLIGSDGLTKDGMLTDKGLSAVGLYAQQYVNAKKQAAEYKGAIEALNKSLANGDITQDEYNDKLYEYESAQRQAALATKEAMDAIIALKEQAINEEIDAMNKLIDAKKDALDAEEDLYEYQKKISGYNTDIAVLEKQIATLALASDNASKAKRLQLEEDLAKKKEELAEYQHDYSIDQQKDALDKQAKDYETAKKNEIEELRTNLDKQKELLSNYLEQVKNNHSVVYETLKEYADNYNMEVSEDLLTPFSSATDATKLLSDAFVEMVSTINYNLEQIDWSVFDQLNSVQDVINGINGLGGGSGLSGSGNYQNVTSQGEWKRAADGKRWWYGKSEDDYVSGGYYDIRDKDGKTRTYGFDDAGYMITGWDNSQGEWSYFEPENGQMVKSSWRKSKGKEYYLQSDGTMARDAAIKKKNGDTYFYVDDNGIWDGQELTKEQVDEMGYKIAYKKGTKHSISGVVKTDEDGLGSEIIITKHGALRQLDSGDHVFNSSQTERLYNMSKIPQWQLGLNGSYNNPMRSDKFVEITSPLIQIDGTGLSRTEIVSIIQNQVNDLPDRIAKTMRRSI